MNRFARMTSKGAMVAALVASAGCASTGDIDALRVEVDRANAAASQAAADAASARQDAAAARAAAETAADTARDTNEKLDRMFKKSMYK